MTMRPTSTRDRGFTLVELIVSIALFTIVVTIAMSAYISLIALDRKARATNELVSNLSFAVNGMSRSIRTGTDYQVASNPSNAFSYTDEDNHGVTYILRTDPATGNKGIGQCTNTTGPTPPACTDTSATPITDPRIAISNMTFYSDGLTAGAADGQPRVFFTVTGSLKPDANTDTIKFTIETAATQRLIDL